MKDEAPFVTLGPAQPPGDLLSDALRGVLGAAEHGQQASFETRDLCLMVAAAAFSGEERPAVPAEYQGVFEAALAELGLEPDSSAETVKTALAAALKTAPVSDALLEALENFRTETLAATLDHARSAGAARLLGSSKADRAPNVEDRPQLTAQTLLSRQRSGKVIIR